MWFVGMIVGAVIGAMGHFEGAVLGGIVGIFAGAMLSSKTKKGAAEPRVVALEDAVKKLTARVQALECGAVARPAADVTAAASEPHAESGWVLPPPVPLAPHAAAAGCAAARAAAGCARRGACRGRAPRAPTTSRVPRGRAPGC